MTYDTQKIPYLPPEQIKKVNTGFQNFINFDIRNKFLPFSEAYL